MTSASGAEWRANNLLWAMIGIYGRQEVQDAPANGGIILFMTVPLVGMLGSSAWFLLAPSYIENFPSEQRLRNQYCYHMGILLLILATFAIMGGFHVVLYCVFGCAVLFALFVLPSMAISKIFRA